MHGRIDTSTVRVGSASGANTHLTRTRLGVGRAHLGRFRVTFLSSPPVSILSTSRRRRFVVRFPVDLLFSLLIRPILYYIMCMCIAMTVSDDVQILDKHDREFVEFMSG